MTMPLRSSAVAAGLAALFGCTGTAVPVQPAALTAHAQTAAATVDATGVSTAVTSEVSGVQAIALDALPAPAHSEPVPGNCRQMAIQPATAGGQAAHAAGWTVTSEAAFGPYTAVGLFSRGQDATSGICLIADGRIVVWHGAQLVAVVEDRPVRDPNGVPHSRTNVATATGNTPPAVRLWDGTGAGPHADLAATATGLRVQPLAAQDSVCDGRHRIPNIYARPVARAREDLAAHGWQPQPPAPADADNPHDPAVQFRAQGLVEFESCSGTGMGYCGLNYRHADGSRLLVTAMGDPPTAVNWTVQCRSGRPEA